MDATTTSRAHDDHYRDIANELRLIVLKMKQVEAAEELRLLAIRYERLGARVLQGNAPLPMQEHERGADGVLTEHRAGSLTRANALRR